MKAILLVCAFLCIGCFNACSGKESGNISEIPEDLETYNRQKLKKLRHIVLLKFKETATQAEIYKVEQAFAKLPYTLSRSRNLNGVLIILLRI